MNFREPNSNKGSAQISPIIKDYIENKTSLEEIEELKHLIAKRYAILKLPHRD